MSSIKLLIVFLFITSLSFAQIENDTSVDDSEELYLKYFHKFGFGKLNDQINFGAGMFFQISEKFLVGIRGNVNSEIEIFINPSETQLDIELSLKYVPIIWNDFITTTGIGVGYASGKMRGKLIGRPVLIAEEYEELKYNSLSTLLEIEIGYFLTSFLGVSVSGYSVFTSQKNIYSYQIGLFLSGFSD